MSYNSNMFLFILLFSKIHVSVLESGAYSNLDKPNVLSADILGEVHTVREKPLPLSQTRDRGTSRWQLRVTFSTLLFS